MNLFKQIESALHDAATGLWPGIAVDKIEATPPKDAAHGDIATNAALVIAPQINKNPREVAAALVERLLLPPKGGAVIKAEIAGPGFINMTLAPSVWQRQIIDILESGLGYGNSDMGQGKRVNIEYVSANPTGPMHVGHGRGAVYGDALATLLLKSGYNVTKEYYINDAGAQVDKLAESAYLRYREACGEEIGDISEGLYPGDYLVPVGEGIKMQYGRTLMNKSRAEWLPEVRKFATEAMMALIKDDLLQLGVQHDVFASERAIHEAGEVEEALEVLREKGLIYTGVLEPPKGKAPEDWEPREQTLFKSTAFGDDIDRPVRKSDGSWTYFAPDIAYHFDKCQRGFDLLVDVLGADHGGYVKRIKAVVNAFTDGRVAMEVKLCQMIKLFRGGEPVKMSKRAGTFITIREVVGEVGKGVFRFIMLTRKNDAPLDFDFEKVVEQSKDNPVFYVQYAHARAHSVLRNARAEIAEAAELSAAISSPRRGEGGRGASVERSLDSCPHPGPPPMGEGILSLLSRPEELALIRKLCNWPRLVEQAAAALEPHRVAFYLQELAAAFHGLWNLGNEDPAARFLVKENIELSASRLALARAVSIVIASGLMVLGVEPVEEMR